MALAKQLDQNNKDSRKEKYNSARHTKPSNFKIGDQVLVRNFQKKSKFEPIFLPERFVVIDVMANGKIILVQSTRNDKFLRRHPNDLKLFKGEIPEPSFTRTFSEQDMLHAWREAFASIDDGEQDTDDETAPNTELINNQAHAGGVGEPIVPAPQRPQRERRPNARYFNDDFVR